MSGSPYSIGTRPDVIQPEGIQTIRDKLISKTRQEPFVALGE